MRRQRYTLCSLIILAVLQGVVVSRCQVLPHEPPRPPVGSVPVPTASPPASPVASATAEQETTEIERRVDTMMSRMTLRQKAGQLFVISFKGTALAPESQEAIQDGKVGGILIFGPNVSSLPQLRSLIAEAQQASLASGAQIPLFVAIDHEGGMVTRLGDQATVFPSPMAIGATRSTDQARRMAEAMASELKSLGINMTLGPVLDVNTNPANPVINIRSFGSDPELVTNMGLAMIEAYQRQNLIAVAKHFPGHGDTGVDSHLSLPQVDSGLSRLDAVELRPFRAAVAADVDAIMTAHIVVPALDSAEARPATLSAPILTGLLRGQWGFDGLIATDSLGMGAISQATDMAQAASLAFEAGNDLLMFGWDTVDAFPQVQMAYDSLVSLVQADPGLAEQLDRSVRRILWAKARRGILGGPPHLPAIAEAVRTPEHLLAARQIAEGSVTLVRDDAHLLPLRSATRLLVVHPQSVQARMEKAFRPCFPDAQLMPVSARPTPAEIKASQEAAGQAEVTLVAVLNAGQFPEQAALAQSIAQQGHPLILAALHSPYDLSVLPSQAAQLAVYGEVSPSVEAMARLLCGAIEPTGLLPVEIPGLYRFGHGLATQEGIPAR